MMKKKTFDFKDNKPTTMLRLILETWALRFLVIGIILILMENIGLAQVFFGNWGHIHQDEANHFIFEIGIAFTVAAFLILTSERVLKTEMESKFEKYLGDIRAEAQHSLREIDQTLERYAIGFRSEYRNSLRTMRHLHKFSHFLNDLQTNENVSREMQTLASDILCDYSKGVRTLEDGFVIEERNWTMDVIKRFYQKLQEPDCSFRNAEIRITHPGSMGIWKNWDAVQDILIAQRNLVRLKNATIRRVFIGTEEISSRLDDQSEYARVMKEMEKFDILCYYVKRPESRMPMDIIWVPRLSLFMQWVRSPEGGSVEELIIRSDVQIRRELETMWQNLMDEVKGIGFEAPDNASIAHRLHLEADLACPSEFRMTPADERSEEVQVAH